MAWSSAGLAMCSGKCVTVREQLAAGGIAHARVPARRDAYARPLHFVFGNW